MQDGIPSHPDRHSDERMKLTGNPSNSTWPSLLLCLLWSGHQPLTLLRSGWEVKHMWNSPLLLEKNPGFCQNLGYSCLSQETCLFHQSLHCRFWAPRKNGTRLSSEVKRATFRRTSLIFTFPRKCHGDSGHHHCAFPQSAVKHMYACIHRGRHDRGSTGYNILQFKADKDCC